MQEAERATEELRRETDRLLAMARAERERAKQLRQASTQTVEEAVEAVRHAKTLLSDLRAKEKGPYGPLF